MSSCQFFQIWKWNVFSLNIFFYYYSRPSSHKMDGVGPMSNKTQPGTWRASPPQPTPASTNQHQCPAAVRAAATAVTAARTAPAERSPTPGARQAVGTATMALICGASLCLDSLPRPSLNPTMPGITPHKTTLISNSGVMLILFKLSSKKDTNNLFWKVKIYYSFFNVAHFALLLPKQGYFWLQYDLFLKKFWFRFGFLKRKL